MVWLSAGTQQQVLNVNTAQVHSTNEGWLARLRLGFRAGPGRTVLAQRERHGPLAVQRPFYPEGEVCHVYLLHPPGGVVGGDHLQIDCDLAAHSFVLVTAPGATKFYRSAGALACQQQHLRVADGASLEWLPQESIFFPGARVRMCTRVDLLGDAHLTLWEILCLGRPANGEAFTEGAVDSRLEIWREGQPLLLERFRMDAQTRKRVSMLAGQPVFATAVFSHASEAHLQMVRDMIGPDDQAVSGATLTEGHLLVRYLGDSTEQAKKLFAKIWSALREPLLGRPAVVPRIWNT